MSATVRMAVACATAVAALAAPGSAAADGVCASIDVGRDNLAASEQAAVRIAMLNALEAEGVAVDRRGERCTGILEAYSIKLGDAVSTTLVTRDRTLTGRASNLEELDLLIRQLVRAIVTGRDMATGTGVTDRQNVLLAQAAPRRADGRDPRRWAPSLAIGGGVLEVGGVDGAPAQRQHDIVAVEGRAWSVVAESTTAFELMGRLVLHDYGVIGQAADGFDDEGDARDGRDDLGRLARLLASPLGVANWEWGIGVVKHFGSEAPRPYLRGGMLTSLLCRFTDPEHQFDVGFGFYGGAGVQLSRSFAISVAAGLSNPFVHNFLDEGRRYFFTGTISLEFRGEAKAQSPVVLWLPPEDEPPTVRRINE